MLISDRFKKFDKDFTLHFVERYQGETDIHKIMDLTEVADDPFVLMNEMAKQPIVYTYWANLKRIADNNYQSATDKMEIYKSTKRKVVVQELNNEGIKTPTISAIESKFIEIYQSADLYQKYNKSLKRWKKRKDALQVIVRALEMRENHFRSMSYLLSGMMSSGIHKPSKRKNIA